MLADALLSCLLIFVGSLGLGLFGAGRSSRVFWSVLDCSCDFGCRLELLLILHLCLFYCGLVFGFSDFKIIYIEFWINYFADECF